MILSIPEPGFTRRMTVYLREMYPLQQRLPMALLLSLSVVLFTLDLHDWQARSQFALPLTAAGCVFFILLLLRLMDELKDRDIDMQLFRNRPLPSGRVRERDIRWSMALVTGVYLLVHLAFPQSLMTAAALLAYTFLMYVYFFSPALLRRNLFLNLATHNPVVPLMLLHLVLLTAVSRGAAPGDIHWTETLLFTGMLWSTMFAWEIARKIRSPREENAYVTYSQLLGRTGAVLLAFGAQSVGAALAVRFVIAGLWPYWSLLPLAVGYGMLCFAYARFLCRPAPRSSALRSSAEAYAVLVMITVVVACGVKP